MNALRLRQALETMLESPANTELLGAQREVTVTARQTPTGSEQLHVRIDSQAFNITITKARG